MSNNITSVLLVSDNVDSIMDITKKFIKKIGVGSFEIKNIMNFVTDTVSEDEDTFEYNFNRIFDKHDIILIDISAWEPMYDKAFEAFNISAVSHNTGVIYFSSVPCKYINIPNLVVNKCIYMKSPLSDTALYSRIKIMMRSLTHSKYLARNKITSYNANLCHNDEGDGVIHMEADEDITREETPEIFKRTRVGRGREESNSCNFQ